MSRLVLAESRGLAVTSEDDPVGDSGGATIAEGPGGEDSHNTIVWRMSVAPSIATAAERTNIKPPWARFILLLP